MTLRGLVSLIALLRATGLDAQRGLSASAHVGPAIGSVSGGEYDSRTLAGFHTSGSVRYAPHRVGLFVDASFDRLAQYFGGDAICRLGTNGQCLQDFPELHGWSTTVGVLLRPNNVFEGRAGVGPGWFEVGRNPSTKLSAAVFLVDVAAYPFQHIGVAGGFRAIRFGSYHGDDPMFYPVSIGLRVRY